MSEFLMHGDCLEKMRDIPDGSVDMVFADLPYGVTANKWDVVIPFEPLWEQLLRVGKKNCAFVFTATQPFATALICSQRKLFRYDLIWDKGVSGSFGCAKYMPLPLHELVCIFGGKRSNIYNPQKLPRSKPIKAGGCKGSDTNTGNKRVNLHGRVYTDKYPTSILRVYSRHDKRYHPTQKPIALLEWLIKTYSNPGDVILDPTMGSGTTGVACRNTGRYFIGIEKDDNYFSIAKARIESTETIA